MQSTVIRVYVHAALVVRIYYGAWLLLLWGIILKGLRCGESSARVSCVAVFSVGIGGIISRKISGGVSSNRLVVCFFAAISELSAWEFSRRWGSGGQFFWFFYGVVGIIWNYIQGVLWG